VSIEALDLGRHVLAQDRILQVLIAHIAGARTKALAQLASNLKQASTSLSDDHDRMWTDHYARQFMRHVEILRENEGAFLFPDGQASAVIAHTGDTNVVTRDRAAIDDGKSLSKTGPP
jgi:hypothetical protein